MQKNSMEKISVIIISYNQKELLRQAIASIINQSTKPFEIIICDDASTDGSQDLIREYQTSHQDLVRGIMHDSNIGISANRNSGIQAAKGDLITWIDGDDIFLPQKLERESNLLRQHGVKWAFSQVTDHHIANNVRYTRLKKNFSGDIFQSALFLLGEAPRNPLVAREVFQKIGLFDTHLTMYEDFDLMIRLAKNYPCAYCDEPMMEYRVHANGIHKAPAEKHIRNINLMKENVLRLLPGEENAATRNAFIAYIQSFTDGIQTSNARQNIEPRPTFIEKMGRYLQIFRKKNKREI